MSLLVGAGAVTYTQHGVLLAPCKPAPRLMPSLRWQHQRATSAGSLRVLPPIMAASHRSEAAVGAQSNASGCSWKPSLVCKAFQPGMVVWQELHSCSACHPSCHWMQAAGVLGCRPAPHGHAGSPDAQSAAAAGDWARSNRPVACCGWRAARLVCRGTHEVRTTLDACLRAQCPLMSGPASLAAAVMSRCQMLQADMDHPLPAS